MQLMKIKVQIMDLLIWKKTKLQNKNNSRNSYKMIKVMENRFLKLL